MDKRTFIALPVTISDSLKNQIRLLKDELKGMNVKWVETENMHLTLSFLGNTSLEQVKQIVLRVKEITSFYKAFPTRLKGLGAFKNVHNPQVLWIGIEADPTLELIYGDIQKVVDELGFDIESRPFKPHLTLGRVKSCSNDNNLKELFQKVAGKIDETFISNTIVYYESTLTPAGPVYKPISVFQLED
jgi:2'-5' RNA ligase